MDPYGTNGTIQKREVNTSRISVEVEVTNSMNSLDQPDLENIVKAELARKLADEIMMSNLVVIRHQKESIYGNTTFRMNINLVPQDISTIVETARNTPQDGILLDKIYTIKDIKKALRYTFPEKYL